MEPLLLLVYSLTLIASMDVILVIAHLITIDPLSRLGRTVGIRNWLQGRHECRRILIVWLTLLCVIQIVLLSTGFSVIGKDIFVLYNHLRETDDRINIGGLWSQLATALSIMSFVGLFVFLNAIKEIFKYQPQTLRIELRYHTIRLPQRRYFVAGHCLLDLCAILSVLLSCSDAWYGNSAARIIRVKLILGFFAILLLASGTAMCIYAVLNWQLTSIRDRAELQLIPPSED
ncbi:MAG: hypothetical protein Q9187_005868 [Circinaria calcarea]